jgi:hypothetical protein
VQQGTEDYLGYLATEHRAYKTRIKYRGIKLVNFLADHDVTRLAQFTATHFDRFRAGRIQEVHGKTLYIESVVTKQFFKWCRSRELIADSPIAEAKLDKPPVEPKDGPRCTR